MGSAQARMVVSGFLNGEEMKDRTVCAPFYLHRSFRVLRGKSVQIGSFFCQSTEHIVKRVYFLDAWTVLSVDCIYLFVVPTSILTGTPSFFNPFYWNL